MEPQNDDPIHFVEDLEERENASGITTMACFETGCGGYFGL